MTAINLVHLIGALFAVISAFMSFGPLFVVPPDCDKKSFIAGTLCAGATGWMAYALLYWVK